MSRTDELYQEASEAASRQGYFLAPDRGIFMASYLAVKCETVEKALEASQTAVKGLQEKLDES